MRTQRRVTDFVAESHKKNFGDLLVQSPFPKPSSLHHHLVCAERCIDGPTEAVAVPLRLGASATLR